MNHIGIYAEVLGALLAFVLLVRLWLAQRRAEEQKRVWVDCCRRLAEDNARLTQLCEEQVSVMMRQAELLGIKAERHQSEQPHTCSEKGCSQVGFDCYHSDDWLAEPRVVSEWLCPEHAAEAGYCCVCGLFCAGMESFDFLHPGYCDNCWNEVRSNDCDGSDEDQWDDADHYEEEIP